MPQRVIVVDAFADGPYSGNPAAVVVLKRAAPESWMRLVAREMNLSETAFLVPRDDDHDFDLRWFTPKVEVALCGHATLASAHVLWTEGHVGDDRPLRFQTLSGELGAKRHGEEVELDFPAKPVGPPEVPPGLAEALGAPVVFAGLNGLDCLAVVASESVVRSLAPDFAALRAVPVRGVIVTARSDGPPYDFVSRFFAPNAGVDEDPVTGSAHCCLGPYWGDVLGKTEMLARQVSERGGTLRVVVRGDRVTMIGRGVTVLRGELAEDAP